MKWATFKRLRDKDLDHEKSSRHPTTLFPSDYDETLYSPFLTLDSVALTFQAPESAIRSPPSRHRHHSSWIIACQAPPPPESQLTSYHWFIAQAPKPRSDLVSTVKKYVFGQHFYWLVSVVNINARPLFKVCCHNLARGAFMLNCLPAYGRVLH